MIKPTRARRIRQFGAGAAITVAVTAASSTHAEDYSLSDVQLYHTTNAEADPFNGTGTSNEKMTAVRAEHYGVWKYGDNYFDVEVYNGPHVGGDGSGSFGGSSSNHLFFLFEPRLSIPRLFRGKELSGFVQDVYVTYRRENASYGNFWADNYGVSVNLRIPGLSFFEQDIFARHTNFDKGTKFFSRTVWFGPFKIGSLGMHFDGLVLIKDTDGFGTNILAQPDLLVDVLPKGQLQVGVRLEYATYDNPAGGTYSRTSPFILAKWTF